MSGESLPFGKSNDQRIVGVSTQSRFFKVLALERVELLLCRAGQVHMSKCIAAHCFLPAGNGEAYQ